MEVSAEDEVEVGVVGGELVEEAVEPTEGGVAGDDGNYVDVDGEPFYSVDEAGKYVVSEAFDDQLYAAFLVGVGDVLGPCRMDSSVSTYSARSASSRSSEMLSKKSSD